MQHILRSGQDGCYDSDGKFRPCKSTGEDGEMTPGLAWPSPRFISPGDELVRDLATGLIWLRDANPFSYPMTWQEALDAVAELNSDKAHGKDDWRLPNRRELRSLIDHGTRKPALPADHPFTNVFLGWYWSSTTAAKAHDYAWYVHMEGGRMFYGRKDSYYLSWPVSGSSDVLPRTGQVRCYDHAGEERVCEGSGEDGWHQAGAPWPEPRFDLQQAGALDRLTGLLWFADDRFAGSAFTWEQALAEVAALARTTGLPWRLPTINELESLVDAARHSPALPQDHPFPPPAEAYWSSTTSFFEPDWAYVLYLHKGAVGVGYKKGGDFALWPVLDNSTL